MPILTNLDLSYNKLLTPAEEDPYQIVEVLGCIPKLKSLDLRGNPAVNAMAQYRSVFATNLGESFEVLDTVAIPTEEKKRMKEGTKLQLWLEQKSFPEPVQKIRPSLIL